MSSSSAHSFCGLESGKTSAPGESRAVSHSRFHSDAAGRLPPLPHEPGMSMATTVAPISSSLGSGPLAEPAPILTT